MANPAEKINLFFSNEKVAERTKLTLREMWKHAKNGLFCDVTLVAALDGRKITAHRSVLCAANEFFQRMFCGEFRESNQKEVTISEVSGDILLSLVEFCYTGVIDINKDNAQLILPQASFMLFSEIVEACSQFQITLINPGNCLSMVKYAKLYNCEDLLKSAEEHMKENFVNVAVTEEYLNLSQEELEEYISSDELAVENEKDVFEAMLRWVNHNVETRSCALSKLLSLIRLHQIELKYLFEYVVKNYNDKLTSSLSEGINQHLFNAQPKPARTGLISNRIVVVCTKKIQIYNPKSNSIEFSCDIPVGGGDFKPTLLGEKLILVDDNKKVRCFALNTKSWHELASMLTEREDSSVEVLNECIYVVGGCTNGTTTNTVERWDSKLNSWSRVKEMNYARYSHCTAIVNGKLYAIGGVANNAQLNSVEYYDPTTDSWSVCSPLLTARSRARAVTVNQEIFVFGGYNDNSKTLNCIEKYNPETNTWTKVGQMSYKRTSVCAYLFNKKIYLFGGWNENDGWLKSMEEFNPITNECKLIDTPNIEYTKDLYCFPYSSKNKF